jgi:hypothetical protein
MKTLSLIYLNSVNRFFFEWTKNILDENVTNGTPTGFCRVCCIDPVFHTGLSKFNTYGVVTEINTVGVPFGYPRASHGKSDTHICTP